MAEDSLVGRNDDASDNSGSELDRVAFRESFVLRGVDREIVWDTVAAVMA